MSPTNQLLDPKDQHKPVAKSCQTCAHRGGMFGDYCHRAENFCSSEVGYGTICGSQLKCWVHRPGILTKIWRFFI